MTHLLRLFLLLLLLPHSIAAQNWKTVSDKERNYFAVGNHSAGFVSNYSLPNPHLLKVIFVDSSRAFGADSVFYFYQTIRPDYHTQCLVMGAPSWLGKFMLRSANGKERYFNSFNDTVTINTQAALGDSWILGKDSAGKEYEAVVTSIVLDTIDGAPDSVKTVLVQARQNGSPVAGSYNTCIRSGARTMAGPMPWISIGFQTPGRLASMNATVPSWTRVSTCV